MSNLDNTDYELVRMDESARQEVIEAKRRQLNEQFDTFAQRLHEKVESYKGQTSNDIKKILALNHLLQREFNQHEAYPLDGFDQVIHGIRDSNLLANNNFVYGENNLATEKAVYVVIEPEVFTSEDDEQYLSNLEKIMTATEIYDLDKVDYKLYLFLNTDVYDIYKSLEQNLRTTVSKDFEIISVLQNIDMRNKAEVTVDAFPDASLADMLNSFITTFGLFSSRRKKIFFNYNAGDKGDYFGPLDFLLLAHSNLPNMLIRPQTVQPLAEHFTGLWLNGNSTFKHRYEEIEDFFNSPSVVLVQGLSPVYGVITGRELVVQGAKIHMDTGEEELVKVILTSDGNIHGLHTEEELSIYLKHSPQNLRDKLIRYGTDVIRVESVEKSLTIFGKNLNGGGKPGTYTLSGDLSPITFLTPYYRETNYINLKKLKGAVPYHLPERFRIYIMRQAAYKGMDVPEVDSRWFSKTNRSLTDVLSMMSEKFDLDNILGYSISPLHGIVNKKILVNLEGLKCLTREK